MKHKVLGVVNIVIATFLIVAINTFLGPCKGAMEMPCNSSVKIAVLIIILLIAINLGKVIVKEAKSQIVLGIIGIIGGVELLFIPALGKCQLASMSCNTKAFPTLYIGALLIIIIAAISIILEILRARREK